MNRSNELFTQAQKIIPGGVNSPVRAFQSVGGNPLFIRRANGAYIYDVDEKAYLDYVGSWGPMILGHNHPKVRQAVVEAAENGLSFGAPTEIESALAAQIISCNPHIEMIRMVNSGTEAVMSALRLARGYTGKKMIIKFAGCYHGHCDAMLVKAGSGALTSGSPDSAGIPEESANNTLIAEYNNLHSVEQLFATGHPIAAVIVEPVAANMGVIPPSPDFLTGLRQLCDQYQALFILDEVITGFRLRRGGAQELWNLQADLTVYGKIIGGGLPVGAVGGRRSIMSALSPLGPVYQAGTLSGNPIAMAAGLETLKQLRDPEIYLTLEQKGVRLYTGLQFLFNKYRVPSTITHIGSLLCIFFGVDEVRHYRDAQKSDTAFYGRFFHGMLQRGVYLAPSQFEAMFLSVKHTDSDIDHTLEAVEYTLKELV